MPLEKQSLNNFLPDGFETNNLEGYKKNFSADKIATGYEKDVIDRVSGPNFNNLLDVLGKNTNVLTNFMDFIKNMPINNIFVVDENNQLAYKPIDEVGGGGLEIGDIGIAPLGIDESKGKRRYLNGQIIIQERYAGFTKKVKDAINLYPSLACSEDEWQTTATMTVGGQVGKFVVDNDAGTIRLPKIIMPIQGLTDLSKLGEIVEAGLPNITGALGSDTGCGVTPTQEGALYTDNWTYKNLGGYGNGEGDSRFTMKLDASRSSSTYGNSDTVQQEQIQYPYFIQVATGAETKDEIVNEHELVNPYVLLEPKFFETPIYNLSWLISNGSFTGSKAVHPHAYDALLIELNADIEVGTTQNNYTKRGLPVKLATDSYTDYDFVVNPTDETFRPPLKVNLASSKAVVGNGIALGLTDGTNYLGTASGCGNNAAGILDTIIRGTVNSYGSIVGNNDTSQSVFVNKTVGVTTDPTKSGLELADSNLYLYFYVGEVAQNTNLVNAGRIEEKLAYKADKVELTPLKKSYIVETYKNGTSWYRVYSDGWCEQGGYLPSTVNNNADKCKITLLKPFKDTNYDVQVTTIETEGFGFGYDKQLASICIAVNGGNKARNWQASGYIA